MLPLIEVTRPTRSAYTDRALVRSVADAPGKFTVVNIAFAGSFVVSTPKLTAGTAVCVSDHVFPRVNEPPNVNAWLPLSQLSVSFRSQCELLRWDMFVDTVPLVRFDPPYGIASA